MKKIILFFLLLSSLCVYAQEKNTDPALSFRAGVALSTTSGYAVSGTDTSYRNYLSAGPVFSLVHRSGFSLDYTPYFIVGGLQSGLYLHAITLGYENYEGDNFTIRTGYTHYFFPGNKGVPSSAISNELYAASDYKKPWLRPAIALGLGFGKDDNGDAATDFNIGAGVKHGFDYENKGIFSSIEIGPSLFVNAGTNDYYSYLSTSKYVSTSANYAAGTSHGKGKGRGNGNSGSGSGGTTTTTQVLKTGFGLSNVELGLYSDFAIHHLHLKPQGSIYVPLRKGDNALGGYWQLNVEYYF